MGLKYDNLSRAGNEPVLYMHNLNSCYATARAAIGRPGTCVVQI
jgi:hypothetical protein